MFYNNPIGVKGYHKVIAVDFALPNNLGAFIVTLLLVLQKKSKLTNKNLFLMKMFNQNKDHRVFFFFILKNINQHLLLNKQKNNKFNAFSLNLNIYYENQ